MKIELNERQIEVMLNLVEGILNGDTESSTYSELKEIKDILDKTNTQEGIIAEFIERYKYKGDNVKLDDNEYNIGLLIEGIDYHCHWIDEDKSKINLNNYLVDYKAIINVMDEVVDEDKIFKEEDEYREMYTKLTKELESIGVTFYEELSDEYDVLMVYSLPTDKILDESFISKFSKILKDYHHQFDKELKLIYGEY